MNILSSPDRSKPIFSVVTRFFPIRHYVVVERGDGRRFKVTRFHDRQSALAWIEEIAPSWIANHPEYKL